MQSSENSTKLRLMAAILGFGVTASILPQIAFAQPVLLVDTGGGSGSAWPLFGTGSKTCGPQPVCATNFQYLGGQFTLANGATLSSVQGWMSVGGQLSMVVRLYADSGGVPGSSLFSNTYPLSASPNGWVVFPGFNPVLPPGTYWLAFEPANGSNFQASMPGGAPNPLPHYAFDVNGNNRYITLALGIGIRVSGTIPAPLPDLTITSTHSGNFSQGQTGAGYTLTVANVGQANTVGTVNVTDTLPAGLSAAAISGVGWVCTLSPLGCTRSDTLAAATSYPTIALTVNVASNAPSNVTNIAQVSGGGEVNTLNSAADATVINQVSASSIIPSRTRQSIRSSRWGCKPS